MGEKSFFVIAPQVVPILLKTWGATEITDEINDAPPIKNVYGANPILDS